MTTNWKEQLFELMDTPLARNEGRRDRMYHFITTLLEKQREEIQDKLNKHWDKLESLDEDKSTENWQRYKCIRNNNNDVINDKTS